MAKKDKRISSPKTLQQYNRVVGAATKYYDNGNFAEALKYYTRALDYKDYHPNVLVMMSQSLFKLGMKSKAIALMEHALHQSAGNPGICDALGNACVSMDLNDLAIKFFKIYTQLKPNDAIGYNNLATALREDGQIDESIQLLQDVLPIYPENAALWNSVGAGVSFRDGYPTALPFYEEAYRLDPTIATISSNICLTYTNLGQYEKALEFAKKSVELAETHMTYRSVAHCGFRMGNFEEAFKGLAWHNHPSDPGSVFMPYNIPKWEGQDLKGKTILIGAEQGIGDEVLFACMYPDVIKEAKHVIIGCDKRLVPLFENSFKQATIIPYIGGQHEMGYRVRLYEGIEDMGVDYMCLYTELMRYKWRSIEDITDMSDGFLKPSQKKVAHWKKKLSQLPHKINIGLTWKSGVKQAKRSMFYAELLEWVPILKAKNVNFINIQYGDCDQEIKELLDNHGITLHNFEELNLKDDFEDVAALLKNLDLAIGTGSSPMSQAATVGTMGWWISCNTRIWWSFGQDNSSPIFKKAKISIKPAEMDWDGYLRLFAEEEFNPWITKKLKEKAS